MNPIEYTPDIYLSDNYLVLDFETTNLDYGSALNKENHLVLSCWLTPGGSLKHFFGTEYSAQELLADISKVDFVVAHNAKFELQWLARCGLPLESMLVWDTMIGDYVLAGNRKEPLDLDSVALRYGDRGKQGWVYKAIHEAGICPSALPEGPLLEYCEQDVELTSAVFVKQREALKGAGLLPTQFSRCLLTPVLADIESNGMCPDSSRVAVAFSEVNKELDVLKAEWDELTGGINPKSPPQVANYLYNVLKFPKPTDWKGKEIVTSKGNPSTDAKVIAKLKARTKEQRRFLELKSKQSKLLDSLSKTLRPLNKCLQEGNKFLYAVFNQCITQTHRLSSSGRRYGVQFQNFPRKYKGLFTSSRADSYVVEGDAAQLEFRVAAFLGQDKQAIYDIVNDVDVHSFTAAVINEVDYEWMLSNKKTDEKAILFRQDAKADTFKPLFGGKSGTEQQVKYYEAFRKKYPGITNTQERWINEVLKNKQLVTCTGLTFYWPDTSMSRSGYVNNSTSICNYPIQSLATADIIPLALVYVWLEVKRRGMLTKIVNTVHDSIIAEVPKNELDEYAVILREGLTTKATELLKQIYNITFNVPLDAEIKYGSHWSEGEEIK